ncbi:hypothetical protein GCM10023264_13350 [Sphingomonas daechungensis]|uniref:2'-5' RNA ligase family protein n=1 Tax=Sphingomonas daechungensis TaxID=1176646 RepID=A0ABX6SXF2_9SPHN|nr:2'-5' RNA ligase family protein [Sphingomonas daechungensis]QNP42281.1 2'-5' RNA ligase family protein [Sphingomonas daechungensis]
MPQSVIAIDVLLEPDERMLAQAERNNARFREAYPDGFALDEQHRPHITLLQCFVGSEDLDAIGEAMGKVVRDANLGDLQLDADRFYYAPGPGAGVAGICSPLTPELEALQSAVIAAAAPFTVPTATIEAFTGGHGNPAFDAALINYVSTFSEEQAGARFNPHVSTGIAPTDYLDRMVAEPFEPFEYGLASAAIYQLGPFGTAARLIRRWDLTA